VEREKAATSQPRLVPGDVFIHNWEGNKSLALDFTVVTQAVRGQVQPNEELLDEALDQANAKKKAKYSAVCENKNWVFVPWCADTYGALSSKATAVVKKIITRLQANPKSKRTTTDLGTLVWRAISATVISRAAAQISRHTALDNPGNIHADLLRPTSTATTTAAAAAAPSAQPTLGMIDSTIQPRQERADADAPRTAETESQTATVTTLGRRTRDTHAQWDNPPSSVAFPFPIQHIPVQVV